jgi:radical SAM protein with 4Fe4S-binding SPASM domain
VCGENTLDRDDVLAYIVNLVKTGFLSTTGVSPTEKALRTCDKIRSLVLHLTEECNLRCKHCYFAATSPRAGELSESEFLAVIRQFAELGGESLLITGGEPLLQKAKLRAVIEEARRRKIDRILVDTNGTLASDEDAAFFRDRNVSVGISLDGATREVHEFIRGKGSYDKALAGIKAMTDAGVNTVIGTTLMKPNLHEATDILHLAKKLNVPMVDFVLIKPKGRAKDNQLTLEFSVQELSTTMKSILRTSKEVGIKTSFEELQTSTRTFVKRDLCGAGIGLIGLAANGDVYPCDALHEEPLKAGNIREKSLGEIWKNSPVLNTFQHLSVTTMEGCKDCMYKFICGNGCPADSYITHGDFTKCSPLCPMYKEIFDYMIAHIAEDLWREINTQSGDDNLPNKPL